MTLPVVPHDSSNERQHRTVIAVAVNELIKVRPPWDKTPDEVAAGVTPSDSRGSARPWVDAVLRYGLVGDGTTSNTKRFSDMCSIAGQALFIKRGDYRTNRFTLPANTTLYLEPGTIIRDAGSLGSSERLMSITNDNVHVIGWGAQIIMDRADYATGEQRHGVYIFGAQNVTIEGLESSDTGGDGFYIGGDAGDPATDVHLIGVKSDNVRRNACSIVNGRRVWVRNSYFSGADGTAPMGGVDVEPNTTTDVLEDIWVENCTAYQNGGYGFNVYLGAWDDAANFCTITFKNCISRENGQANGSIDRRGGFTCNRVLQTDVPKGIIKFIDCVSIRDENAGVFVKNWDVNGPRVEFIRPIIFEPNQEGGTADATHRAISLYNDGSFTQAPGNVHIIEPVIDYTETASTNSPVRIAVDSGEGWDNCTLENPKINAPSFPQLWTIDEETKGLVITSRRPLVNAQGTTQTFTDGRYLGRTVTNASAGALITYTLVAASTDRVGWRFRFEVTGSGGIAIDPNGTDLIRGGTAGQYLTSTTIGDNVEIECDSATSWKIVSRYGTWSFV
jgi:hypothetical protein